MSRLTLGVPPITANFRALSMLTAVMAVLAAVVAQLGVNLRTPNALASLRVALGTLPLAALAQLRVNAASSAAATATATATAQGAANAAAALNLSAVAQAHLTAAGRLAVLMQLTTNANFLLAPPGACRRACPLAPLEA
jgi:hypothetical protein